MMRASLLLLGLVDLTIIALFAAASIDIRYNSNVICKITEASFANGSMVLPAVFQRIQRHLLDEKYPFILINHFELWCNGRKIHRNESHLNVFQMFPELDWKGRVTTTKLELVQFIEVKWPFAAFHPERPYINSLQQTHITSFAATLDFELEFDFKIHSPVASSSYQYPLVSLDSPSARMSICICYRNKLGVMHYTVANKGWNQILTMYLPEKTIRFQSVHVYIHCVTTPVGNKTIRGNQFEKSMSAVYANMHGRDTVEMIEGQFFRMHEEVDVWLPKVGHGVHGLIRDVAIMTS